MALQGDNLPGPFGKRNKFARPQQPSFRVIPANQKFDTGQFPFRAKLGLGIHCNFVLSNRAGQFRLHRHLPPDIFTHGIFKYRNSPIRVLGIPVRCFGMA